MTAASVEPQPLPCEVCGVSLDACMWLDDHCCVDCRLEGCHPLADPGGAS